MTRVPTSPESPPVSKPIPFRVREGDPSEVREFLAASHAPFPGTTVAPATDTDAPLRDAQGRLLRTWVAEREGRVAGLIALARNGDASYWVPAEEPDAGRISEALLAEGEAFALSCGAGAIRLYVPEGGESRAEHWTPLGYRPIAPTVATMRVLDLSRFLLALAAARPDALTGIPALRLHLHRRRGNDPSIRYPDHLIRVGRDGLRIEAVDEPVDADIRVDLMAQLFTRLVMGAAPIGMLEDRAAVRISPPERTRHVRALIEALRPQGAWFTPIGDRR